MDLEINNFLDKYEKYYPEFKPTRIREKVKYGFHCDSDQIICHLNKINIEDSAYYKFFGIIKENFNLNDIKILDVACGLIPILSKILKDNTNSEITAINKQILFNNYGNVRTQEIDFSEDFDISNFDLLIGFRPCYTTETIIDLCFKNNKDFIVYLCPCDLKPHHETNCEVTTAEEWRKYIINKVKSNTKYDSKIFSSTLLQDDLPVIVAHYKG